MNNSDQLMFRKPPVVEVKVAVQFINTLAVADERSKYHAVVKDRFPFAVIPDQKSLQYNFGDYVLWSQDQTQRLEISMNYFRFATTNYIGFASFRSVFSAALELFVETYGVDVLTSCSMQYSNKLPVPLGSRFEDCFALQVSLPGREREVFAAKGNLVFREDDLYIFADIEPQLAGDAVSEYSLNLGFGAQRQFTVLSSLDPVLSTLDTGHKHVRDYLIAFLKPNYLEELKR